MPARVLLRLSVVFALPLLMTMSCGPHWDDCGPFAIAGDPSELTVAGLDGARWAVSQPQSCSDDYDIQRVVVSGTGEVVFGSVDEQWRWIDEVVVPRLEWELTGYWFDVWYDGHICGDERHPGMAIGLASWLDADIAAKILAQELARGSYRAEIALILQSDLVCAY